MTASLSLVLLLAAPLLAQKPIAEKNFVFEMLLSLQLDEVTHYATVVNRWQQLHSNVATFDGTVGTTNSVCAWAENSLVIGAMQP